MKNPSKSQILASIRKSSNTIYGVSTGLFAIMIVGMICLMAGSVIISYGNTMTDVLTDKTFISYNGQEPHFVGTAVAFCIGGIAEFAVVAAIIASIAKMFRFISKDGMPFTEITVKYIRSIAVLCLVNAFLPNIIISTAEVIFGTSDKFRFDADLGYIAVFMILLTVGKIITYGQMLQQESDETL